MACSSPDLDSIDLDLASRNLDLDLMTILHIIDLGGLQISRSRLELDQTFFTLTYNLAFDSHSLIPIQIKNLSSRSRE